MFRVLFSVRWCPGHMQRRGRSGRCCALVGMSLVRACAKEPLLSEGLQKLFLCGLAQLCFRSQVGVSGWTVAVLLLAGGGIYKFKVYGSRSRNEFGAVIYTSLAAVALIFLGEAWAQSEPMASAARALKMAAVAAPVLLFLHLQLMPGDIVLQANGTRSRTRMSQRSCHSRSSHGASRLSGTASRMCWLGIADMPAGPSVYRRACKHQQTQLHSPCFKTSQRSRPVPES